MSAMPTRTTLWLWLAWCAFAGSACVDDVLVGNTRSALELDAGDSSAAPLPDGSPDGAAPTPDGSANEPDAGDGPDARMPDASEPDGSCADGGYLECDDLDGVLGPCPSAGCGDIVISVAPVCDAGETQVCWEVGDGSCALQCRPRVDCARDPGACGDTGYCFHAQLACGGAAVCAPSPTRCLPEASPQPVCGCDGVTYESACEAASARQSLLSGASGCLPPAPKS